MKQFLRIFSTGLLVLPMPFLFPASSFANGIVGSEFDCTIEPRKTAQIGSFDDGILESIPVERGDTVTIGQVLAVIESSTETLAAELARIQAETDVDIRSREARHIFQKRQTERAKKLLVTNLVSNQEVDDARIAENLALLEVESAVVRQASAKVQLALAEARLERRSIKSPINGIVTEIKMSLGEYVHEQTPLMVLADIEELNVEVYLPVTRYGEVSVNQNATVAPIQPIGGSYNAVVRVVDKVFDAASSTFGVRLLLSNPDRKLPAGIRCKVNFLDPEQDVVASTEDGGI
ncbi:MAG: RND family efflux transporter MFP subunit [Paraglaciecola sp.]|jgi:RND family efflux transporter MFP subunit